MKSLNDTSAKSEPKKVPSKSVASNIKKATLPPCRPPPCLKSGDRGFSWSRNPAGGKKHQETTVRFELLKRNPKEIHVLTVL